MKCKRDSDWHTLDRHALQMLRQKAVKAVRNGQTPQGVAETFGLNIRTVFRWLSDYAAGGLRALLNKPIPGHPPKVPSEELRWIAETMRHKTPLQLQFDFALWTLSLIGEVIYQRFGKRLNKPSVSRIMRLLGFPPQRPLYRAWQQDPVLVETWRTEVYPALQVEAKRVGAVIYFADEAGVRSDYHAGTTWAPCGTTPIVRATGRRFGLNMISAVSARGDFRFMLHEGSVTAKVFRTFLQRLLAGAKQAVFRVVDGHPIHKAKLVSAYVAEQEGRLKLLMLPPYSACRGVQAGPGPMVLEYSGSTRAA